MLDFSTLILTIVLVVLILLLFAKGVVIVQPYQKGLAIRLGTYTGQLNPGFKWVVPFITKVVKLDLRTQVIDVPSQEVITKDNSPTDVDAIIYVRVMDPERAFFEVSNYRQATVALAQTSLRGIIGDMELDETLTSRDIINSKMRAILDEATDPWGIKVNRVELKNIIPPKEIQDAMEKQMKAERERRESILKAEGEKKSAILVAEGRKQSSILEAEANKAAQILEAEAAKESAIRRAEGEAEAILKIQQATADGIRMINEAAPGEGVIAIKSLEAFAKAADGKATKIIIPSEIQSLAGLVTSASELAKKDE